MRNGSGTYSAPSGSFNPATNGNSATAADWDTLLADLVAAMTQSVSADGQTPITGNFNMGNNKLTSLGAGSASGQSLAWQQLFSQGTESDLPSAATTDIGAQNTNFLRITGTATITSFGTNYNGPRFLRFAAALTLTHNATTLILPGGANITTAAGDTAIAIPISGGWYVIYQRADGTILQQVATSTVLGRTTAGTGSVEVLTANQARAIVSGVPAGAVMEFAMNTAPTGWLKANGAAVSRTTYADLFSAIGTTFGSGDGSTTFNVPELRGEFIRGWDDGRGVDSGRVFGSAQGDLLENHTHDYTSPVIAESVVSGATNSVLTTTTSATGNPNGGVGGSETRPRNIALLACIKF